jgi:hypothetical protein
VAVAVAVAVVVVVFFFVVVVVVVVVVVSRTGLLQPVTFVGVEGVVEAHDVVCREPTPAAAATPFFAAPETWLCWAEKIWFATEDRRTW